MELKEGMYIRYIPTLGEYTQKISKITKTKNCLLDMAYTLDNEEEPVFSNHFDEVLKASYNIIDLIEVGDYVNGYKIYSGGKKHFDYILTWDDVENYYMKIPLLSVDIKSIVTKEQFESMSYKVGE